jgi:hypothetical protein
MKPKENILNIHCMEDIFDRLDEVCDNEEKYTDEELTMKLKLIYDFCNGGKSGRDFYLITHMRSTDLLKKRAIKY